MRKWNSESGMSLVEATIILMTLAILTAVIAPSAGDYINEARNVKAKEDVEAIGTGILRLLRDTGNRCLLVDGAAACTKGNRVDLLLGSGNDAKGALAADYTVANAAAATDGSYNWAGSSLTATQTDTIDEQLVVNTTTPYSSANLFTAGGGPRAGIGWRGAYLTGATGADPWGYKYQANAIFLGVAKDGGTGNAEGESDGGWTSDVIVVSGGTNGAIETSFGATGAQASDGAGDDVIYTIKGSTR